MTQREIDIIQQEIYNKSASELIREAQARNSQKELVNKIKQSRKWK